jgi:ABC-type maltose transport system permease subunit
MRNQLRLPALAFVAVLVLAACTPGAASSLSSFLVLFLVLQRYYMQGFMSGAVKG